jgi:PAS domain S-box-containing protein
MAYVIIRHRLIQENIITNQLGERVKEQACLHKVSLLTENTKNNLEHVLDGTVRAIPFGWQYPDITCSRITFKEKCFKSIAFIESEWKQEHELIIKGEVIGKIEVFYKKEKPNANIGPFLSEEKILLDSIGSLIISYYERKLNEDNLIEINNNLRAEIAEKLKTEKDLKASEERFQLAVKGSNAGIWDLDVEKGSAYWSNIHYSLLGYELDEVTPTLDFLRNKVHTEDLSIFDKSFKNHIEGGSSLDFEARYYKKNGEQRWFRSTGASARDKDGRATRIIGTFSDITEIKTWQQSLIDKEQQLRYALDVSNEGIWEWISGEEQINYSNRCYSIAGYIFEEIQTGIDDFWKHIIHKDDSQQLSVLLV